MLWYSVLLFILKQPLCDSGLLIRFQMRTCAVLETIVSIIKLTATDFLHHYYASRWLSFYLNETHPRTYVNINRGITVTENKFRHMFECVANINISANCSDFLRMRNSRFTSEYVYCKNWVFVCRYKWLTYFK